MPALTPIYNFVLPTVGADLNVWGGYLNTNMAAIEGRFNRPLAGFGTVFAPAYSFVGRPTQGMYSKSSTALAFAVSGSEQLAMTSLGVQITEALSVGGTLTLSQAMVSAAVGTALNPTIALSAGGAGIAGIYSPAANILAIETANAEALRITAAGALLVGQAATSSPGSGNTTVGHSIAANGAAYHSASATAVEVLNRNTSNGAIMTFNREGLAVGSVSVTTTGTTYNTTSDRRLKSALVGEYGAPAVDTIKALAGALRWYAWVEHPSAIEYGWFADELQLIMPDAVTGKPDAHYADGRPLYQQRSDVKLIPTIVAALAEALEQIKELRAEIAALKA